jgi:hypothetical protein
MSVQIQNHLHRIAELEEKHEQAELNCQQSANCINQLNRQRDELEQENRKLKVAVADMASQVRQTSTSDAEVQQLREQLASLQRSYSSKQDEIHAHKLELQNKEDALDRLNERFQDLTLGSSLTLGLTDQISELHDDISSLQLENQVLKAEAKQLMQDKATLAKSVSALTQERSALVTRISTLEEVRLADGVIVCIDLSSSLSSRKVEMAKEAFRIITSGIRARNPNTHLGAIVQDTSIWTARNLSKIDTAADGAIDRSSGGGTECYRTAIPSIEEMMSPFWARYPKRATRVILIGDGQAVGGYPEHLLTTFRNHGTPIHNVVVQSSGRVSSPGSSSTTAGISNRTNGLSFAYNSNFNILSNDALLGRGK